ncbi:MAG TPA: 4-(cytidine 5'-diphospho)-2-C-methyl-D-erythritol kinase [Gemmatimonadaceae bacterium]
MSELAASVVAHAKINLGLRVLAREETGFHAIETVFARLALGDLVTVRVVEAGRSIECRGADVGPSERNLAYRAASAFADTTGWPRGFAIEVDKRVPVGGGLGGGSADAGAVLRALAALSPQPISRNELLRIAGPLGSDVPFLTSEAPLALAWGRGERMLALPPLPEREVALVMPGFAVATAEAYGWLAAERGGHTPVPQSLELQQLASWDSLAQWVENDFEGPVALRHPEIVAAVDALRHAGASIALMSGSGSTVFGVFAAAPAPASLAATVPGTIAMTRILTHVPPVRLIE